MYIGVVTSTPTREEQLAYERETFACPLSELKVQRPFLTVEFADRVLYALHHPEKIAKDGARWETILPGKGALVEKCLRYPLDWFTLKQRHPHLVDAWAQRNLGELGVSRIRIISPLTSLNPLVIRRSEIVPIRECLKVPVHGELHSAVQERYPKSKGGLKELWAQVQRAVRQRAPRNFGSALAFRLSPWLEDWWYDSACAVLEAYLLAEPDTQELPKQLLGCLGSGNIPLGVCGREMVFLVSRDGRVWPNTLEIP